MRHLHFPLLMMSVIGLISSCETLELLSYQVNFISPEHQMYHLGDTLFIQVEFRELSGGTIYHINVRMYNRSNGEQIYNEPASSSISDADGLYFFRDEFVLDHLQTEGVWVLEASAWGNEDRIFEVRQVMEILIES